MTSIRIAIACCAILIAVPSFAQTVVRELITAGGKRMDADQIRSALSGKRMTGLQKDGYLTDFNLSANGWLSGVVHPPQGKLSVNGSWSVKDGHYCMDIIYPNGRNRFCNAMFQIDQQFFVAEEDPSDDALLRQRKLE